MPEYKVHGLTTEYWCSKCGAEKITTPVQVGVDGSGEHRHVVAGCFGLLVAGPLPRYECGCCGQTLAGNHVTLSIALTPPGVFHPLQARVPPESRLLLFHNRGFHPTNETPGWLGKTHDAATLNLPANIGGQAVSQIGRLHACGPLYPVDPFPEDYAEPVPEAKVHAEALTDAKVAAQFVEWIERPIRDAMRAEILRAVRAAGFPERRTEQLSLEVERLYRMAFRPGERPQHRVGSGAILSPREMVLLRWILDARAVLDREGWEEGDTNIEWSDALYDFLHNIDVLHPGEGETDEGMHTYESVAAELKTVDRKNFPR